MNPLTLLCLLFVITGLLLSGISIPLIQRRIKPNLWYGYRTRHTLSDPKIWYAANAYAGKRLFISGLVTAIAALGLYLIPGIRVDSYGLGMTIFTLGPVIISLAQSSRYIDRYTNNKK